MGKAHARWRALTTCQSGPKPLSLCIGPGSPLAREEKKLSQVTILFLSQRDNQRTENYQISFHAVDHRKAS